ncbi:glycoside hydrolase family 16 protein [Hortaea werneckii]|nr:glycoside hydrolase family 16 protein [Hortaea werneckii]
MRSFNAYAALAATFAISASAATTCDENNPCPESAPCCSQYGQCGVGAYCLGGCDPRYSYDLQSCVAAPVCKSQDYKLNSLDDIMSNQKYLGDYEDVNWVASGDPLAYNDDSVLLTMAPDTSGTLLMSTKYVWYGKISATLKTSAGAGVVTAFILMSDVKDEIDFEFVGVDMDHAQSNYYFQGITDYENGKNLSVSSDTRQNSHTYTIDWKPDYVAWYIDGEQLRTVYRNETYNETNQQYHFPQTPSRVQLSLWPAGRSDNAQGTINWAGGEIDWNSQYMTNGYYYAMISDVNVECYDPPDNFDKDFGDKAYYYTTTYGTNDTVAIGNNNTELASFLATGDDKEKDPNASKSASASGTKSTSSASESTSATPETVPGISGGGNDAISGHGGSSDSSNSGPSDDSSNSNSGDSGSSSDSSSSSSNSNSFVQGGGQQATNSNQAPVVIAGSGVALLGFFVACLLL